MPRDPFSFQSDDDNPLTLTRSPESQTSMASSQGGFNELSLDKDPQSLTHAQLRSKGANISARNDLHPYVQTLSLADVDSCVALENAAFPENERCSREKVRQVCICVSPVREMVLQWLGSPSRATAKLRTLTCVRASGIVRFNARECSDVQKRKKRKRHSLRHVVDSLSVYFPTNEWSGLRRFPTLAYIFYSSFTASAPVPNFA